MLQSTVEADVAEYCSQRWLNQHNICIVQLVYSSIWYNITLLMCVNHRINNFLQGNAPKIATVVSIITFALVAEYVVALLGNKRSFDKSNKCFHVHQCLVWMDTYAVCLIYTTNSTAQTQASYEFFLLGKECKDSSECDPTNHEVCAEGSCVCESKYVRVNSLRCVPALGKVVCNESLSEIHIMSYHNTFVFYLSFWQNSTTKQSSLYVNSDYTSFLKEGCEILLNIITF